MATPSRPTRRALAAAREATRECVVIYLRVSTDEQVSSGLGLEAQEAEARRYAEARGWSVSAVLVEDAVSGRVHPMDRPAFGEAVARLDACDAGTLLVRRQDRVSRRLRHLLDVIDHADRKGWGIATTDGRLDTGTAAGRLQVNVMASVAEYERDVIAERTKEALSAKREAGARLGRRSALPVAVLARIVSERADGATLTSIATRLNADRVPTVRGGICWRQSSVSAALRTAELDREARQAEARAAGCTG